MATSKMSRQRRKTAGLRPRLPPVVGLPRRGREWIKDNLRMLHMRGIAPKLTRKRGFDGEDRRPDLRRSPISKTAAPWIDSFGQEPHRTMATMMAQQLGRKRMESMGTTRWPTAVLWTPGTASSATPRVEEVFHVPKVRLRRSSPEETRDGSNTFGCK
uniref:Uncharacterized protein n=1 Tax=Oryza meridionalis TaxID=40149 RepID=A0A0E0EK92_9ORYZ